MSGLVTIATGEVTGQTVTSLHVYLQEHQKNVNSGISLLRALETGKGIGKCVPSENHVLYYCNDNPLYHVFSNGGRAILIIARASVFFSNHRENSIRKRFLLINQETNTELTTHFQNLIKLSSSRQDWHIHQDFVKGSFTVHMKDLMTPYIEIGRTTAGTPLVVPAWILSSLVESSTIPLSVITYCGQKVLIAANDDFTVRVAYVSHILEDTLFLNHGRTPKKN